MTKERIEVVRAMDLLVRCCNDEDIIIPWLMNAVADGDAEMSDEYIAEYYCDDNAFRELTECFLRRMQDVVKSGGLYCDGIVTREEKL